MIPLGRVLGKGNYYRDVQYPNQPGPRHGNDSEGDRYIGNEIVNGNANKIIITPEDFRRLWKKVNKLTLLLMSGVHYGHYKAATQDLLSTEVLATQLTVIAWSRIPPDSWSVGLQVMLEKIAGVCLVEKLRAIQLYEADFNC